MKNISRSLGSVKSLFLTFLVITSTNLLSQENEEQILNINLGLYVCENELSKEVPEEEIYGFDCSYRKDMNNEIEIVSVVLNRNIFIDDHKEACIRRISTVEEIYNAIEGIGVSESGRTGVNDENWLWADRDGKEEGLYETYFYIINSFICITFNV